MPLAQAVPLDKPSRVDIDPSVLVLGLIRSEHTRVGVFVVRVLLDQEHSPDGRVRAPKV